MPKNVTIRFRLIFVIAFLSMQLLVGGMIGIVSLGFANDSIKSMYDDRLVSLGKLDQIVRLLSESQLVISKTIAGGMADVGEEMDQVDATLKRVDAMWQEYAAGGLAPDEKKLADRLGADLKKFTAEALLPATEGLRASRTIPVIELLHGPMTHLFLPVRDGINDIIKFHLENARQEFEQAQTTYNLVRAVCLGGIALGLLLVAGVGVWLIRAISQPLKAAVHIAGGVAAGDLTQAIEVRSNDETGQLMQALKRMNDGLAHIVGQVREGSDAIAEASRRIADGNIELSVRAEQQTASLRQMAAKSWRRSCGR